MCGVYVTCPPPSLGLWNDELCPAYNMHHLYPNSVHIHSDLREVQKRELRKIRTAHLDWHWNIWVVDDNVRDPNETNKFYGKVGGNGFKKKVNRSHKLYWCSARRVWQPRSQRHKDGATRSEPCWMLAWVSHRVQSYIISLYDYVIKTVSLFGLVVLDTSKIQLQKGSAYFEMSIKIRKFNTSGV